MSAGPAQVKFDGAAAQDILARIERLPLSSWQIRTRIIVGTATFFDAFDALSIAYVLPVIVPLWKLAPAQIGTLISFGFLGQLIGALIGGSLAERFGRRPVIIIAVTWFGLLSFACGFAWSYDSLLVLRLLQGLGLGAEVPVAATYISELARAKGRGRFVLLFELVFPLGLLAAAIWSDLFGGIYLKRTLVIWVCWFATYFANYGLTTWLPTVYQNVFKLPLDRALTYGLAAPAAGLLTSFACAMLIDYVGRRIWFAAAFAGAAIGFLSLWWIGPTSAERVLVLSTLAYMCISTLSLALYLYTAELYPTRVRALGTSTATAWLRLASILGPQIVGFLIAGGGLGDVFLVFGLVVAAASVTVALFATETRARVLEAISP
jgi:MFS family permease